MNHVEKKFDSCDEVKIDPKLINITSIDINRTACIQAVQSRNIFLEEKNYTITVDHNEPEHFVYDTQCDATSNTSTELSYEIRLFEYEGVVDLGKNDIHCRKSGIHCSYDKQYCQYLDTNLYWNMNQHIQLFNQLPVFVDKTYSNGVTEYLILRNKNNLVYPLKLRKRRRYHDIEFWSTDSPDIIAHSRNKNLSVINNETYLPISFRTENTTEWLIQNFCSFSISNRNSLFNNIANNDNKQQTLVNKSDLGLISKMIFYTCLLGALTALM